MVSGLFSVAVLGDVSHVFTALVVDGVLKAECIMSRLVVVSWFVVYILVLVLNLMVAGNHCMILMVDWASVRFVLQFNVRLLLVVLLVVRVEVSRHLVVHGVLVNNAWLIVVLVVGQALDEVVRLLVVVLVVAVLTLMVVMEVIVVDQASLAVMRVVTLVIMVSDGLVVSGYWLVVSNSLVMSGNWLVMLNGLVVSGVASMVVDWSIDLVDMLIDDVMLHAVVSTINVLRIAVMTFTVMSGWQGVNRDLILHLSSHEDLRESEADGVAVFVEVLVLPLGLGVHDFMMDVLSIDNEIVLNMEDEIPWVSEGLGHFT
mgnify:CR=1 FL=1